LKTVNGHFSQLLYIGDPSLESHCPALQVNDLAFVLIVAVVITLSILLLALGGVMHLKRKRPKLRLADDPDCEYDAFLSYAEEDEDCASRALAALEDTAGMRCLLHTRDFEAGRTILDNIQRAVSLSRCTVLVVSKDYLKSQWCDRELSQAEGAGRRVVVVMRRGDDKRAGEEDLKGHPAILAHVSRNTYLDESAANFESKLAAAVGPRPAPDDEETTACLRLSRMGKKEEWRRPVEMEEQL